MLQLFKKPVVKKDIYENPKNYPKEVLEIHHEFDIASDKLVEQALNIINAQPSVNKSKISLLEKYGFKQTKEIEEGKTIIQKTELSQEQIDLVDYYKREYPFNKFITEEQVKIICHKYNLVCGDVSRFKGFVPEKNLSDIEKFKLKDKDVLEYSFITSNGDNFNIEDLSERGLAFVKSHTSGTFYITGSSGNNIYTSGHLISSKAELRFSGTRSITCNFEKGNPKLQICAPIKDMDISGLELTEGYKLTKKHIPDPVVLQPVKNGYLIITAWGDEASDPLVINEINN